MKKEINTTAYITDELLYGEYSDEPEAPTCKMCDREIENGLYFLGASWDDDCDDIVICKDCIKLINKELNQINNVCPKRYSRNGSKTSFPPSYYGRGA